MIPQFSFAEENCLVPRIMLYYNIQGATIRPDKRNYFFFLNLIYRHLSYTYSVLVFYISILLVFISIITLFYLFSGHVK